MAYAVAKTDSAGIVDPLTVEVPLANWVTDQQNRGLWSMRLEILDGLRGAFLLLMMWSHLNALVDSPIGILNHHRTGFADSAHGFVVLSGLVVGLVFTRTLLKRGGPALWRLTAKRLRVIYLYVAGTAIIVWLCMVIAPASSANVASPVPNSIDDLLRILSLTQNGPSYQAILPMYLVLIALAPICVIGFVRGRSQIVLGVSFAVWATAQIGLPQGLLAARGFGYPWEDFAEPFVLSAWQFPFVIAIYLGYRYATDPGFVEMLRGAVAKGAFLLYIAFLCIVALRFYHDLAVVAPNFETGEAAIFHAAASKWIVSPIYLLSMAVSGLVLFHLTTVADRAAAPLVRRAGAAVRRVLTARLLVRLGQASIQVFSAHVIVLFFTQLHGSYNMMSDLGRVGLQLGATASLFCVPWLIDQCSRLSGAMLRALRGAGTEAGG